MGIQRHLDVEAFCPLSGFVLNGSVIPVHKMAMLQCENGALFARCPNHQVRAFISDFTTVRQIMSQAVVLQTTASGGRKKMDKEKLNGKT